MIYDKNTHITNQQAKQIKDKVEEIVGIHESAEKFKNTADKGRFFDMT